MKKLRVIMATRFPYSEADAFSGLVQVSLRLCNALAKRSDIELHVVTTTEKVTKIEHKHYNGYEVSYLPRGSGTLYYGTFCLSASLAIREISLKIKPDIIHAQGVAETMVGSILSGIPTVATLHGIYKYETISEDTSLKFRIARQVIVLNESWYVKRLKHVISLSPYVSRFIQKYNASAQLYNISNPIDPEFFDIDISKTEPKCQSILLLGSISYRKGHDLMIDALSLVAMNYPEVKLSIIGSEVEASFAETIRQKISSYNLTEHVRWLGALEQSQLIDEMKRHQILCLPSRGETLPMSISQAMVIGNLCVASDAGGIPDMIQDGVSGFLFSAGDALALANTLMKVMQIPQDQLEIIRWQNRAIAEKTYNPDSVAEQTVAVYHSVLCKDR